MLADSGSVMNVTLWLHRHLGSQLAELERVIERMMEADFVEFATANLSKITEDELGSEDLVDEVIKYVWSASDKASHLTLVI